MVDSCRKCEACRAGDEHFCNNGATGMVGTYNAKDYGCSRGT